MKKSGAFPFNWGYLKNFFASFLSSVKTHKTDFNIHPQNYSYSYYKSNAQSTIYVAVRYFDNFGNYKLEIA